MDENKEMSQTQPTAPDVDTGGNLSAAMQESTAQFPEPNPTALLQIDPNDQELYLSDIESALGAGALATSTSITSSIQNYQYENGRRYHALREGEYLLPNDAREQDRLDLHHHIFRLTIGGPLIRAPIPRNPQLALDLGTGTGIWAIDFAEEYPSALEYEAWVKSDDDPELLNAAAVLQWQQLVDEATVKFGKKPNMVDPVKQRFIDAGSKDVPIGPWPLDQRLKILGLYQLEQMCDSVEAFTLPPLTRILNWSHEETQVLIAKIRSDLRNKRNHLHIDFRSQHRRSGESVGA
ncbi:hypothetical protein V491_02205 [Pseudogymnoascus sp. VKM F-3775]|nr:hypothetical protein V491_02205 [Pseudogymnoascus sp. VKM F-3775]